MSAMSPMLQALGSLAQGGPPGGAPPGAAPAGPLAPPGAPPAPTMVGAMPTGAANGDPKAALSVAITSLRSVADHYPAMKNQIDGFVAQLHKMAGGPSATPAPSAPAAPPAPPMGGPMGGPPAPPPIPPMPPPMGA